LPLGGTVCQVKIQGGNEYNNLDCIGHAPCKQVVGVTILYRTGSHQFLCSKMLGDGCHTGTGMVTMTMGGMVSAVSSDIVHDTYGFVLVDMSLLLFHSQMNGCSGQLGCGDKQELAQCPKLHSVGRRWVSFLLHGAAIYHMGHSMGMRKSQHLWEGT